MTFKPKTLNPVDDPAAPALAGIAAQINAEVSKVAAKRTKASAAVGRLFDSVAAAMNEEERAALFAAFEVEGSAADRRVFASHPLRPCATDALVEKRLGERDAQKEAERKTRAALKEQRDRAKFEELRAKFGGQDGTDPSS
jgi:hypothetical protein